MTPPLLGDRCCAYICVISVCSLYFAPVSIPAGAGRTRGMVVRSHFENRFDDLAGARAIVDRLINVSEVVVFYEPVEG